MSEIKKVVLAYSGGLDTSIIIPWLKENYDCEVICVSGNVGQDAELEGLEERAKATGASKLYIEDIQQEFVDEYVFPTLKAGAIYEGKYLLGTSFARPVIAKRIVEIAKAEGKYKGRKPVAVNEATFRAVCARWRAGEITATAAMQEVGLKPNTFYRRVKALKL